MDPIVRDKVTGNYARIVERTADQVRLENPYVRLGWRRMAEVEAVEEEAKHEQAAK